MVEKKVKYNVSLLVRLTEKQSNLLNEAVEYLEDIKSSFVRDAAMKEVKKVLADKALEEFQTEIKTKAKPKSKR